MKTIQQFAEEIMASEDLKKELAVILVNKDKDALLAFTKENGCEASMEEIRAFLKEKMADGTISTELTDDELEQVTGGSEVLVGIVATVTMTQCFVYMWLL